MTITRFPHGVSSFGVPIIGSGSNIPSTTGSYFFVDSVTGSNGNEGITPENPFATLDYAIGKCTANKNDVIILMPNHAETLSTAAAIVADIAGILIIGLGVGDDRPTFTFGTVVGTDFDITAVNVKIKNIIGLAALDGLTNPFHVAAADCDLDITWREGSSAIEAARAVLTTAAADRFILKLCYEGETGGDACVNAVRLVGCNEGDIDIDFYGKASTAIVEFITTPCTNIDIRGYFYNSGTTNLSKNVVDTITGSTWSCNAYDAAAGCAFSGGSGAGLTKDQIGIESLGYNSARHLTVTADFTNVTWNTIASHEIFVVTGIVRMRVLALSTGTGAGATATVALGIEGATADWIAATTITDFLVNEIWCDATPTTSSETTSSGVLDKVIMGGKDVGYTIATAAATGGGLEFHCWWEPISSDGLVTAGAGGPL